MPLISESSYPRLHEAIMNRNLNQQYYLLETATSVSLGLSNTKFTFDVILALHGAAANFLDSHPGRLRDGFVHINNSKHTPPPPDKLRVLIQEYLDYLNNNFSEATVAHLAAYALWRLVWIHPFFECNGRTARAFSYYVACLKMGYWPGGENNDTSDDT